MRITAETIPFLSRIFFEIAATGFCRTTATAKAKIKGENSQKAYFINRKNAAIITTK